MMGAKQELVKELEKKEVMDKFDKDDQVMVMVKLSAHLDNL